MRAVCKRLGFELQSDLEQNVVRGVLRL
jgi:hypothetical protein